MTFRASRMHLALRPGSVPRTWAAPAPCKQTKFFGCLQCSTQAAKISKCFGAPHPHRCAPTCPTAFGSSGPGPAPAHLPSPVVLLRNGTRPPTPIFPKPWAQRARPPTPMGWAAPGPRDPASPSFLPMADVPPPRQEGRPPGREPGCPGPPRCPSCSSGPGVGQALGRASCGRWEQGQAAVTWGSGSPPGFWNQAARAWVPTAWDRPARRQLKALPLPAPLPWATPAPGPPWAKACLGSRLVPPGSGIGCQASPFPSGNNWFVEPSPSTCRTARRACPAPAWPLGAGRGRDFPLSRAAPALRAGRAGPPGPHSHLL